MWRQGATDQENRFSVKVACTPHYVTGSYPESMVGGGRSQVRGEGGGLPWCQRWQLHDTKRPPRLATSPKVNDDNWRNAFCVSPQALHTKCLKTYFFEVVEETLKAVGNVTGHGNNEVDHLVICDDLVLDEFCHSKWFHDLHSVNLLKRSTKHFTKQQTSAW